MDKTLNRNAHTSQITGKVRFSLGGKYRVFSRFCGYLILFFVFEKFGQSKSCPLLKQAGEDSTMCSKL